MKTLFASLILLVSTQAFAGTVYLNAGESRFDGRDTVVCGGGNNPPPQQNVKWMCGCFDGNDNIGMVYGIWAPEDQQSAEYVGIHACVEQKHRRTTMVSCSRQTF